MARTCIICGESASSREHVFPASLGGRRTNKGIYCGNHNNQFSPLAATIANQLKVFNAFLGVRPDHSDKAKQFDCTSPNGEEITISRGSIDREITNFNVIQEDIHLNLVIGGPDGLKSITYIALTFFAHYFPSHARSIGLKSVKDFLQNDHSNNDFAWWLDTNSFDEMPLAPFTFSHIIAVSTSKSTKEATVFLSLFGALNFGVRLGEVSELENKTVVVFINPLANCTPNDIKECRYENSLVNIQKPEPLQKHLLQMVGKGGAEKHIQELANKMQRWKFDNEMGHYIDQLNSARLQPDENFQKVVINFVEDQTSRVYQLMRYVVENITKTNDYSNEKLLVIALFEQVIAIEGEASSDLSPSASKCTECVMIGLIEEIVKKLRTSEISTDYLYDIFKTNVGAGIAADIMLEFVLKRFESNY